MGNAQLCQPHFNMPCTADQIPGVHPWGLKRSFPKPNNVPTPRAQNIVKNVQFPACSRGFPGGQPSGKPMISALRTASRSHAAHSKQLMWLRDAVKPYACDGLRDCVMQFVEKKLPWHDSWFYLVTKARPCAYHNSNTRNAASIILP